MFNLKLSCKVILLFVSLAVAVFSIAYAAVTNDVTVQGNTQTVINPDVYFVNGYGGCNPINVTTSYNPSGAVGSVALSGARAPGEAESTHKTGKTANITGAKLTCVSNSYIQWKIPIKNYGVSPATRANPITVNISINGTTYSTSVTLSSTNNGTATFTGVSGLQIYVKCPASLNAGAVDEFILKATITSNAGITAGGTSYDSFTITGISVPYN